MLYPLQYFKLILDNRRLMS